MAGVRFFSSSHPSGRRRRAAIFFLLPMMATLAVVAVWPLAKTVAFSFTDAYLGDLSTYQFIGVSNYTTLLHDPQWWRAVTNTLIFTVASVGIETFLGLIIALVLNAHIPGRGLLRAAILIPWAIPTVVSAKMWGWMLNDLYGVVNAVLLWAGAIQEPWAWLADPVLSMISIVAVDVWKTTPFMALLALAALQVLPAELYEAARVDGIHPVRVFFNVTLPLIRPALLVAVIFRGLDAMRVFDIIYVLTGNNPDTASMSIYARQQLIEFQEIGLGSAAATLLFLTIAALTVLIVTLGRVHVSAGGGGR